MSSTPVLHVSTDSTSTTSGGPTGKSNVRVM